MHIDGFCTTITTQFSVQSNLPRAMCTFVQLLLNNLLSKVIFLGEYILLYNYYYTISVQSNLPRAMYTSCTIITTQFSVQINLLGPYKLLYKYYYTI